MGPGPGLSPRVLSYLLGAAVGGYFLVLAMTSPLGTRWLDFPVYWEAGRKAIAGATVYDVAGHFQYKYSPLVALLFGKLFQTFAFETASWIFQKSMLVLWAVNLWRVSGRKLSLVCWIILFFGNALRLDLALGQMNALAFFLLLHLFANADRRRNVGFDFSFGVVFSLAVQIKLFAFVVVPLLLFRKEWRKLAFGILLLPALSVGGVATAHGWSFALAENREWLRSLATSTDDLVAAAQNVGWLGFLARALPGPGLLYAKSLWLATGAVFLAALWKERARSAEWFRDRLLFVVSVFNPLVWSYWILFAFPIFLRATRLEMERWALRSRIARGAIALQGLFIFVTFNGQHARWAWTGGILGGLYLVFRLARERKPA